MELGVIGFDIGQKHVGDGFPCLVVGEVAQAHDGSLGMAHAYVDAIAEAGADAIKFQCHIADAESTPDEAWRVEPKWRQDASRYAYWKRMEFSPEQWAGLEAHAGQRGLIFLCSAFSVQAVELLDPLVPAWKVASGEIENHELLYAMSWRGRKPFLVSTGMSTEAEISNVLVRMSRWHQPYALLQCTSEYPTPPEHLGLNIIRDWRRDLGCPVGLSDHSGTIYAGLAAVAQGCDVLEVHVKLSRDDQGLDASSSITPTELRQLVDGVRFIHNAMQYADKDVMARQLEPMRELFMRKYKRRTAYAEQI